MQENGVPLLWLCGVMFGVGLRLTFGRLEPLETPVTLKMLQFQVGRLHLGPGDPNTPNKGNLLLKT